MAEVFGLVSGTVGIATAFSACVECFEYVQVARRFGKDFETGLLTMDLLRLRLSRWGQAVHMYDDPQFNDPRATQNDLALVNDTIFQIMVLLDDSRKVSERYQAKVGQTGDLLAYTTRDMRSGLARVGNKMRNIAALRQKQASLPKLAAWALYSKEHFSQLANDISGLLDNLEKLFPAPENQVVLAKADVRQLEDDMTSAEIESVFDVLKTLSEKMDHILDTQLKEATQAEGHSIGGVNMGDRARAFAGNTIDSSWQQVKGQLPRGGKVTVGQITTGNDGRFQAGDSYTGGSNGFWDI